MLKHNASINIDYINNHTPKLFSFQTNKPIINDKKILFFIIKFVIILSPNLWNDIKSTNQLITI